MTTGRELAYLALLATWKDQSYLSRYFDTCRNNPKFATGELKLAQEIAYGVLRHETALEYLAAQLAGQKITGLRNKHKALLYGGLYQLVFLDSAPPYAVVNEYVALSKRYCHRQFANFLNALLRQTAHGIPTLPCDLASRSIRYSIPEQLIKEWDATYGQEQTALILKAFHQIPSVFVRIRNEIPSSCQKLLESVTGIPDHFYRLKRGESIGALGQKDYWYIQNPTPFWLTAQLAKEMAPPLTVLDLCCSPGGKLIACHDHFPEAKLTGNDVSLSKIERIKHNLRRLDMDAELTTYAGEDYPLERKFDLVILDVPCSNTGVLHKRPEAKKREHSEMMNLEMLNLQRALLARAVQLVNEGGQIWYLTCSLSRQENERQTEQFCAEFDWEKGFESTVLPNEAGWDGGYGCALRKR